jgi:hypothetical protein
MLLAAGLAFGLSAVSGYYYTQLGPIGRKKFLVGVLAGATTTLAIATLNRPAPQYYVQTRCCNEETGIIF